MVRIISALFLFLILFFLSRNSLTFEVLKQNAELFYLQLKENRFLFSSLYFISYVIIVAAYLPGGALFMTLLGGFLFGNILGLVLVSFASSIGATIAFLLSRYLFADHFKKRFFSFYQKINKGVEEKGAWYLLSLRLTPIIPFFIVNLVSGLTKIKTKTFYLISQLGMLPLNALVVNAGTQLASLSSPTEIISWKIGLSLTLIAIVPVILKKTFSNP